MFWLLSQPGVGDEQNGEGAVWLNVCPVWAGALCPLPNSLPLRRHPCGCSMQLQRSFSAGRDPRLPRRASSGSRCSTFPCLAEGPP